MNQTIGIYYLLKIIFSLSGRTTFYVLLFLLGCYLYSVYGGFLTGVICFATYLVWRTIRFFLFQKDLGVFPNFK